MSANLYEIGKNLHVNNQAQIIAAELNQLY